MDAGTTSLAQQQQVILDDINKQIQALMDQRSALDKQKLDLIKQTGSLTSTQQATLNDINNKIDQISVASAALITREETITTSTDAIAKQAAKEALVTQIKLSIPPPPAGAINIVHSSVAAGDIISYIKFTQYLNPYGRRRQCDADLENLMAVIGKSADNELAEYTKHITDLTNAGS